MTPVDYLSNKYPRRGSVMATYSKTEVLQMLEEYNTKQIMDSLITKERYEMLIESHKTGANLAPIDFEKIEGYEKVHNLPDAIGGRVGAVVMPNEVIGGGHLTDKEFETLSVRITPAFYDIDLDGATNCKGDVLRKLRIIFNDIIDSRREA